MRRQVCRAREEEGACDTYDEGVKRRKREEEKGGGGGGRDKTEKRGEGGR